MMRRAVRPAVVGLFGDADSLLQAARDLRAAEAGSVETISPVPLEEANEILGGKRSPVRYYTLAGALLGFVTGWALTTGSVMHYPLIVGGKPLLSLTPFGVIAYICTILFGALFTVAGMLLHAGLPRFTLAAGYDSRLTGNRFGLLVLCKRERFDAVSRRLLNLGAEEVKHVAV
jgi:molybdopterin-containing oxidoreductase family membrane subunit